MRQTKIICDRCGADGARQIGNYGGNLYDALYVLADNVHRDHDYELDICDRCVVGMLVEVSRAIALYMQRNGEGKAL